MHVGWLVDRFFFFKVIVIIKVLSRHVCSKRLIKTLDKISKDNNEKIITKLIMKLNYIITTTTTIIIISVVVVVVERGNRAES